MSDSIVTKILDFPIGRYPLVMYSMIAITTGIIAYATVKSDDESSSSDESASDDEGADDDADADESSGNTVFGNLADALPTIPNVFRGDEEAVKEEAAISGGKNRKNKKTKRRRHRQRRSAAKNATKRNRTKSSKK